MQNFESRFSIGEKLIKTDKDFLLKELEVLSVRFTKNKVYYTLSDGNEYESDEVTRKINMQ